MRCLLIALSFALGLASARAEDAARTALASELTEVMQVQKSIEDSFAMVRQMIPQQTRMSAEMAGQKEPPAGVTNVTDHIMDVLSGELSWAKIKDEYIALYAETFTEEELKGLIAFYKSPAGQAFVAKQPELMRRSVQINQRIMMNVMPKLQSLMREARSPALAPRPAPVPAGSAPAP